MRGRRRYSGRVADDLALRLHEAIDRLMRAFKVAEGRANEGRAEATLVTADVQSLMFVGARPDSMASELAAFLGVAPTTASSVIDRLVRRGLLVRERTNENRRVVRLRLTDEGEAARSRIVAEQLANCREMLAALPAAERKTLVALLAKVAAAVSPD